MENNREEMLRWIKSAKEQIKELESKLKDAKKSAFSWKEQAQFERDKNKELKAQLRTLHNKAINTAHRLDKAEAIMPDKAMAKLNKKIYDFLLRNNFAWSLLGVTRIQVEELLKKVDKW